MSENRFLQSFFAVSASAVLVSGTLLLLSSTAPWNPPQLGDGEPSTPDAARLAPEATASIDIEVPQAPLASDQADTARSPSPTWLRKLSRIGAQARRKRPAGLPARGDLPEVEAVAALGTPLSPESADVSFDGSIADAPVAVQAEVASRRRGQRRTGGSRRVGAACRDRGSPARHGNRPDRRDAGGVAAQAHHQRQERGGDHGSRNRARGRTAGTASAARKRCH